MLALGGCAHPPSPWAVTDPARIEQNPNGATVVIGQVFLGRVLTGDSCPSRLVAEWSVAESRMLAFRVFDVECIGPEQPASADFSRLPAKYTILSLAPGNYRLDQITRFRPMLGEIRTPIADTRPTNGVWSRMTVPRFSVAAGEVVHVGTLVYLRSDPAELRVTANLEDARTALRAVWPAGANRLIERRMLVGPAQP